MEKKNQKAYKNERARRQNFVGPYNALHNSQAQTNRERERD